MSAITEAPSISLPAPGRSRPASALLTLARRRASLTSKTPRQIAVPLLGPALLALVVAPALKVATGGARTWCSGISSSRSGSRACRWPS